VKDIQKLTEQASPTRPCSANTNDGRADRGGLQDLTQDHHPVVKREDVGGNWPRRSPRHGDVAANTPTTQVGARRTPRQADIPMPPLPDQLSDLIGDLIKQEDQMTQEADDQTSAWADSISPPAGASTGRSPTQRQGVTANQLPTTTNCPARRRRAVGKSEARWSATRPRTRGPQNAHPRHQRHLRKGRGQGIAADGAGGATGAARCAARPGGTPGPDAPAQVRRHQDAILKDWQQRLRQQAEHVAGQLRRCTSPAPTWTRPSPHKHASSRARRPYVEMFHTQQMVVQDLRSAAA